MSFIDILQLALRNLRQAKLRAILTTMGVVVGVAVIVTMVSFGLGLQGNMLARFKALDLFSEIRVFGKSLGSMAATARDRGAGRSNEPGERRQGRGRPDNAPTRILDDTAVAEIAKIPGVAYVEPHISFGVYVRSNGRVSTQFASGVAVPNSSTRFQEFVAGSMISSPDTDQIVISERFARDFGYENYQDAVGKTVELLAPNEKTTDKEKQDPADEQPANFFGIPLDDQPPDASNPEGLVAKTFRIAGVLKTEVREGPGQGGLRGLLPTSDIYLPLPTARAWTLEHRSPMGQVALELARGSGALGDSDTEGYDSAVVRVADPVALTGVRKSITDLGFGSFSIVDELEQLRTVFLILDSVLALLGGISLLVASFGIANTMIMSILERTREIGIMKAIGAEDREIKLIFFVEAAVIGLTGGVVGTLVAWGVDGIANRLAYRFILKPQGASYVDFFSLPPYLSLGAILFAVVISILAALYPAARAARIDPVKALRHD
ncbi:MAG: ABC transporter permease [Pyrinomonadaceae bacterium]|nr:ABC transporter permease [Pyrinomonadaceae bacterium]